MWNFLILQTNVKFYKLGVISATDENYFIIKVNLELKKNNCKFVDHAKKLNKLQLSENLTEKM